MHLESYVGMKATVALDFSEFLVRRSCIFRRYWTLRLDYEIDLRLNPIFKIETDLTLDFEMNSGFGF